MNKKQLIARLSIISNISLITLKVIVGLISGSISIISEAVHSCVDLVAAIIAYLSVRISDNPPDKAHPYGHGKFENISGVLEAILIFIAAGIIVFGSVRKLIHPEPIEKIGLGSLIMLVSAVVNAIVSAQLYKVSKETDSVALEADALHLKTDVYTSLGVGLGLLVILITDLQMLDPVIALLVAMLIVRESYFLLNKAYRPLLDTSLDEHDINKIKEIISSSGVKFHDLKTRKAGSHRFVEFHLDLPPDMRLDDVHDLCDKIEANLKVHYPLMTVMIHAEPLESK
jgi:cation diffusion facilitator family transporter